MSRLLVVVDRARDWAPYYPSDDLLTFDQYLHNTLPMTGRVRVINLCQSSRYRSQGYYCSLLAEARGHTVLPSVMTLNDLSRKGLFSLQLDELDGKVVQWLDQSARAVVSGAGERQATHEVCIRSFFGQVSQPELQSLARALFERFPCPILKIVFRRRKHWRIDSLRPGTPRELTETEQDQFASALDLFSRIVWRKPRIRRSYRFDLAMLVNPDEKMPPSDETALKRFERAGRKLGINVERITRGDYMRLPEYDGLFIRETTAIDHHTYRFARKAEAEGMVVIDDPASILRCTNKVYLADLFRNRKVPVPKTLILSRDQKDRVARVVTELGLPVVLKIPDGAFSLGVIRAGNEAELASGLATLFRKSALVLAQEYFYTDYDWRIGVLGGRAIYACKYMMVKGHWQIYQHGATRVQSGGFETLPTCDVPRRVIQAALDATRPIGNGLYGVDIKQAGKRVAVIEVNDNPSVDSGVEDRFLGKELYMLIMQEFLSRMESRRRG